MDILIIGAGGQGRVVLDIMRESHIFNVVGFLDGNQDMHGLLMDDVPIVGPPELALVQGQLLSRIVAIGDNAARQKYADRWQKGPPPHADLVNAIHPRASISPTARIGRNVTVCRGAQICSHAAIADSTIINTGAIIEHECQIAEAVHVAPGARIAGRVTIGARAFIGIGAIVIQNLTIGSDAVVGAGAVVLEDVPAGATVVGCPARIIKIKESYHGGNPNDTSNHGGNGDGRHGGARPLVQPVGHHEAL